MHVISINISRAKPLSLKGKPVPTGIIKEAVEGPIPITQSGVGEDHIEDLTVHGGDDQAVYCYGVEDYAWWSEQLGREIAPGTFGEKFNHRRF